TGAHIPPLIDLAATVREGLVQLTPWLLSKGLELVFDASDDIEPVRMDPADIHIALNNLVTNAANFSPAQGQITVRLIKNGNHYELSVEDEGP
ncbi:sensor histidine kinase, partial [Vibrio vulnificus]|uniref:sensor histidine kinase n=1 Tax=Vibrio vulnificus TaxID=672 RepID=UPI0039B65FD9